MREFDENDIDRLMANPGIIRARAKIYGEMRARGEDFAAWCWSYTDGDPQG